MSLEFEESLLWPDLQPFESRVRLCAPEVFSTSGEAIHSPACVLTQTASPAIGTWLYRRWTTDSVGG